MYWDIQNTSSYGGSGTIITDLKGNSNGTLIGTIPFTLGTPSSGNPNYLEIQGSSSEYISTNTDLNPFLSPVNTGTEISHFIWVYPTINGIIVNEQGSSTPMTGWHDSQVELVSNNLLLRVWNLSPPYITSNISLVFNTWNYIGLTYNSDTTLTAYLNGVAVGTANLNRQTPFNNGGGLSLHYSLGANDTTNMGNGTGSTFRFGAFHVYNRALSSSEVNENYNLSKNSYLLPPSTTPTPSITPSETPTPSITPPIPSITPSETPTPPIPSITPSETPTPSITLTPTPTQTVPQNDIDTNGLILYINSSNEMSYPGTGTSVFDLSPNGYTGTLTNTAQITYTSTQPKSINFGNQNIQSGPAGHINWGLNTTDVRTATSMSVGFFGRVLSLPHGNGAFQLATPIGLDTCASGRKFIMDFRNPTGNQNIATAIHCVFFDSSGTSRDLSVGSANWLNQDLYVVATCDSTNTKLYINGELVTTLAGLVVQPNPNASALLATGRVTSCFQNSIGESKLYSIHIYNRALSLGEIQSNYNVLKNQFGL
jgi:hypothetical protein